jgi:hypothetical protein
VVSLLLAACGLSRGHTGAVDTDHAAGRAAAPSAAAPSAAAPSAAVPSAAPTDPLGPPASVAVGSTALPSPPVASGFVGIALELDAVPAFVGKDPANPDPVLVQLLRNLAPGQAPVLRIGGDSTDYSWWPAPGLTKPLGIHYTLTPRWMATLKSLAQTLGAHLIVGLNWAAHDPALTLAEAKAYAHDIGPGLISEFELGNEPGYYGHLPWYVTSSGVAVHSRPLSYSLTDYLHEYQSIVPKLPDIPMAGPGDGNLPGVAQERGFVAGAPRLRLVTMHRYPLIACTTDPAALVFPSTNHLLERFASAGLANGIEPYVRVARAAGLRYRLDEMNSVSCRGAPVSRTFASALWVLDQLFQLVRVGVNGANFNTFTNALYEPFGVTQSRGQWSADVRPMYYGMLMFAQAAPPGSRLLQLHLQAGAALRAWATRAPDGAVHVVLINDSLTTARPVTVSVAGWQGGATLTRLSAPKVTAREHVTIGGQAFAANTTTGQLEGNSTVVTLRPGRNGYSVTLPPASAAMVTVPIVGATR